MRKILTDQQISDYHDKGFVSPITVMSESEAAEYHERLMAAERDYPDQIHAENRMNAHLSFSCLDELAHHPVILDTVEDLLGPSFSLWASVLFIKEPQSAHFVSWHQDATYMYMNKNTFLTPWIALTPSNLDTGCMSMIPGSHKAHIVEHEDTFGSDNILTRGQRVNDVDESTAEHLILEPGQMSIHHCETIHGSQPNRSAHRRVGFALQSYMANDVRQELGKNQWMHCRGHSRTDSDTVELHRPRYDLDPISQADRAAASANYSDILYNGSKERRAY